MRPRLQALILATSLFVPGMLAAQNEAALRQAFEGKMISVKIAMPGTSRGIDVFPQQQAPVNFPQVADRMKDFGTALKAGDQVMVSKIAVKGNSHIEFQLGGGGYGTLGDDAGTQRVFTGFESETAREKVLRDSIKVTSDATRKRQMEQELRNLRSARDRENDRARAEAEQANAVREANVRSRREQGGSRFNIRFRDGIPPEALTPAGIMAALSAYVDFEATGAKATAAAVVPGAAAPAPRNPGGVSGLRKGLSLREVEAMLGPAETAGEERQGIFTVLKRSYTAGGMKVMTSFVNDVLIDFTMSPR